MRSFENRVLLVDKPAGATSFDAVRVVRRATRQRKVGHCGSLDPLATGLLVLCTGWATRLASLFTDQPKTYEARLRLGIATDTDDADGRVLAEAPVPSFDETRLQEVLERFVGEIEQVPPMVSALKHQGKRLYAYARQGQVIERAPRRVRVYALDLLGFGAEHVDVRVRCGRGCYVRSLAVDIGAALGTRAHLERLRRTAVGRFDVAQAAPLDVWRGFENAPETDLPPGAALELSEALTIFPALHVRRGFEDAVQHGAQPELPTLVAPPERAGIHRILSEDGARLLAVARSEGRQRFALLRLVRVFPEPLQTHPGARTP